MIQLVRQFASQVQIAVHHVVDDAQHQVGRPAGQACAGRAGFGRDRSQQLGGIGVKHRTAGRVHGQQDIVKHSKADRAGVNAAQDRRPATRAQVAQRQPRPAQVGLRLTGRQPAEHQHIVLRGVVVVRGQLVVQQVGHVQIDQRGASQLVQGRLNLGLQHLKLAPGAGNPQISRFARRGVGQARELVRLGDVTARNRENPHRVSRSGFKCQNRR